MARTSRRAGFMEKVGLVLDTGDTVKEIKELQELTKDWQIDLDSKEFEDKVASIVKKMSKDTVKVVGDALNKVLVQLGKNPIPLEEMIALPNEQMWAKMGDQIGKYMGEGLSAEINRALQNIDIVALQKKVEGIGDNITITPNVDVGKIQKQVKDAVEGISTTVEIGVELISDTEIIKSKISPILSKLKKDIEKEYEKPNKDINVGAIYNQYAEELLSSFELKSNDKKNVASKLKKFDEGASSVNSFIKNNVLHYKQNTNTSAPKQPEIVDNGKPTEVLITPTIADGAVAKAVQDNVVATPPVVEITPTVKAGAVEKAIKENLGDALINVNVGGAKERQNSSSTFSQITLLEANKILENTIGKDILQKWNVYQDHEARQKIDNVLLNNEEAKNAAMNVAYYNHKNKINPDISFSDFLNSDIPVYRGKKGSGHFNDNQIISFTQFEEVAKRFGENILQTVVKPRETLGSVNYNHENELFVPKNLIAQRKETADWLKQAGNIPQTSVEEKQPAETKLTPTFEPGSIAQAAIDNVSQTPAEVTITPKFEDGAIAKAVAESIGQNPDIINNAVKGAVEKAVVEEISKKGEGAQQPQSTFAPMSREDAVGYIAKNYDYSTWENWFTIANDTARTKIAEMIEKDEGLRNATLNQMWDEYKKLYNSSISFEEFLQTEIPLYRGELNNSKSKSEKATSFTLNKKILESYDSIFETKIKPADTLGMPRPLMVGGESEVFVPNDYLKNQAGYNEWVKSVRTEIVENKQLAITYDELKKKLETYAEVKREAVVKHYAGQDISDLTPTLRAMEDDITQYFDKNNPEPTQTPSGYKMLLQDAHFDPNNTLESMCRTLGIEIPQAAKKAEESVESLQEKLNQIQELDRLKYDGALSIDVPRASDPEYEIEKITKIKELYSKITGETEGEAIDLLDEAIREAQEVARRIDTYRLNQKYEPDNEALLDDLEDSIRTPIENSREAQGDFWDRFGDNIRYMDEDIEERIAKITQSSNTVKEEVVAREENAQAIKEETQAQKELNVEKKKESLLLLGMYAKKPDIWKEQLQNILNENPNIIEDYTAKRDNLQSKMQSVQDTVNRISNNSSAAKIPYDQLRTEIVKTGQALATMYDAGITDTEEYITLQYKLLHLLDKDIKPYGTVKSAGAKNKNELKNWQRDSILQDTGYDVYSVFDALRGGQYGVLDNDSGKQRTMRDVASQLVGYKGFADFDAQELDEYKAVVNALTQIKAEMQSTKAESDALNESLEKQATFHDTKSGQVSMFPESEQEKGSKEKSVVTAVAQENTVKAEQISIDDILEQSVQEVVEAEKTETALIKANTEAIKDNVEAKRELINVNNQQSTDGYEEFYQNGDNGDNGDNGGFKVIKHRLQQKDGEIIAESQTAESKTDNAIKTVEATKLFTEQGEINLVTITEDFKKFDKEVEKTEKSIEKAKKKLGEFLDKFRSKTGGKAEFVTGFNELNNFYNSDSLNADNIEDTYNKMIELQKEYAKLELSFRKGQSSLNPFVNSINKAENIDNIFGNVQNKFDGLIVRSDELTDNFEELRALAEKIKAFSERMASGDNISPTDFASFAQDMGNFNLLRTQVEGQIKSEGRNTPNRNKYLKDLGKMYTRKGELGATVQSGGTEEEKVELMLLRAKIKAKEQYLSLSKEESAILQQNARDAFSQQLAIEAAKQKDTDATARTKEVNELILKQEKLGKLEAQFEQTNKQEKKNVVDILQKEISAKEKSLNLTTQEIALMQQKKRAAYDLELGKQLGKSADKIKTKNDNDILRTSRANWRVNKANSVYNSGLNLQDSLGMLPEGINQKNVKIINEFNKAMANLNAARSQIKPGEIVSDALGEKLKEQRFEVQKTSEKIKELIANYEMLSDENSTYSQKNYTGGDMKTALIDAAQGMHNSKIQVKEFDETTRTLTYTVKTGAREFTTYKMGIRDVDNQMRRLTGSTKKTEGFFEATKRKMGEITSYFTGMAMISRVTGELRKGIQYVREIDSALTELKKVTDETDKTYDKFLDTASKTAAKVGSTIKEVVSSTADFARLGYTLKEAAMFAESAQILMNVSEFTDVSRATDTLISAVQAFGYTAETSMEVVDLLNMIGKIIAYR